MNKEESIKETLGNMKNCDGKCNSKCEYFRKIDGVIGYCDKEGGKNGSRTN